MFSRNREIEVNSEFSFTSFTNHWRAQQRKRRDREAERQRDRGTERQMDREREGEGGRERETEKERGREREGGRERERRCSAACSYLQLAVELGDSIHLRQHNASNAAVSRRRDQASQGRAQSRQHRRLSGEPCNDATGIRHATQPRPSATQLPTVRQSGYEFRQCNVLR